jgi:hypothetical protein
MSVRKPFLPPRNAAPKDPAPVRKEAYAVIAGASDQERVEAHIQVLRRFTDLALREAERLDRQAEAVAAQQVMPATTTQPNATTPETAPPQAEPPNGEMSRALFRLARTARDNIAQEQRLIEDLRYPGPRSSGSRGQRAQEKAAKTAAEIDAKKAEAESFVRQAAATNRQVDQAKIESLVGELREGFADGRFDEALQTSNGSTIGWFYLADHKIEVDWAWLLTGMPYGGLAGTADPVEADAMVKATMAKLYRGAAAPEPVPKGQDPP